MKIGQIYLERGSDDGARRFATVVESLDRRAIDQHALVSDVALARGLHAMPYVQVGPVVQTPVMAYCLMPDVDVVHLHDDRSGQAGLLLTLTRSIPYVLTSARDATASRNPLRRSVYNRALCIVHPDDQSPERLVEIYRRAVDGWLKLPQDANCG